MAGPLGRVLVAGKDRGAGFALSPGLVVTAGHVIRGYPDKLLTYVPAGGEAVSVARVQIDTDHDTAVLWLDTDAGEYLATAPAVREGKWRVQSPPPGSNDPELTGTVTASWAKIRNAAGQQAEVVQLEVDQQLGDFGGYSGSAVLDSLGNVIAVLVEQKLLRTTGALGEKQAASNVLYGVPIGNVIAAFDLPVQVAKPIRFDVGLLPPGMVTRRDLLDEAVRKVVEAGGGESSAGLVLLRGPGGIGKTVLARQVADDGRVWAGFPDGIIMLRVGQNSTSDGVARQLKEALGYRERDLADVLAGQRLLLVADDVWDGQILRTLQRGLPATVVVLATTRGASVPGAAAVKVGAVAQDQAIQILARNTPRSEELDRALGDLAETLFRWALLLTLAAAELHRGDDLGWGFGDDYDSSQQATAAHVLFSRAETLRVEFPDDPTMLDELEDIPEDAAPRSVDVLVRRSLKWLGPERQARFELLSVYPSGADITQLMLEDLWATRAADTRKIIRLLVGAGLAQPIQQDSYTIELHDLITAWLHHECGRPDDARHQQTHRRLAGLSFLPDASPGALTQDRAEWLFYHLVAAAAWDSLATLPTLRWRSAFLVATGSDAAFLAGLDYYGGAVRVQASGPVYPAVRAWLFAAYVRTLISQVPIPVLTAMAQLSNPIAALAQAIQHPKTRTAVRAVLSAIADRPDSYLVLERAAVLAGTIGDTSDRSSTLAAVAEQLVAIDSPTPGLIDRALSVAQSIPDDSVRSQALATIIEQILAADSSTPALNRQIRAAAETIPDREWRARAVTAVVVRLIGADFPDPALVQQVLALASTIPDNSRRSFALAEIAVWVSEVDELEALALMEQALDLAGAITDDSECSSALAAIAGRLAAANQDRAVALTEQALALARGIADDSERSSALTAIVQRLVVPDPPNLALIKTLLPVLGTISDRKFRTRALAAIVERLPATDPQNPALLRWALDLARTIPIGPERIKALTVIVERLALARSPNLSLIDQALAMVGSSPNTDCYRALAVLSKRLAASDPSNSALIERALTVAGSIFDGEWRAKALADISGELTIVDPDQAAVLVDRAVAVAQTTPERAQSASGLAAVARHLVVTDPDRATLLVEQALTTAQTIPDPERYPALAAFAERLAAINPANSVLIEQAHAVVRTISDDRERRAGVPAAVDLWPNAADPPKAALTDMAFAAAFAAARALSVGDRSAAMIALRAVAAARALPVGDRSAAVIAMEQLLSDGSLDQAMIKRALVAARRRGKGRSGSLAVIAERLAVADPGRAIRLFDEAVTHARGALFDQERDMALAFIAERMTVADPSNPMLLDRAQAVAESIADEQVYCGALIAIAERLAVADFSNTALFDRALAVAASIDNDQARSRALATIAKQLAIADLSNPVLLHRALAAAEIIPDDGVRSNMILRIRALTRDGMLDEMSRWRLRSLGASINLLTLFLQYSHDETTAESIGLAVLQVAEEAPAGV